MNLDNEAALVKCWYFSNPKRAEKPTPYFTWCQYNLAGFCWNESWAIHSKNNYITTKSNGKFIGVYPTQTFKKVKQTFEIMDIPKNPLKTKIFLLTGDNGDISTYLPKKLCALSRLCIWKTSCSALFRSASALCKHCCNSTGSIAIGSWDQI